MNIRASEVDYKKSIGSLNGRPVIEIGLKGGLHLVVCPKGNHVEYLGAGPHRAVARHMAKKHSPDLKITDLTKSDHIEPEHFAHLIPYYEALTSQLDAAARK